MCCCGGRCVGFRRGAGPNLNPPQRCTAMCFKAFAAPSFRGACDGVAMRFGVHHRHLGHLPGGVPTWGGLADVGVRGPPHPTVNWRACARGRVVGAVGLQLVPSDGVAVRQAEGQALTRLTSCAPWTTPRVCKASTRGRHDSTHGAWSCSDPCGGPEDGVPQQGGRWGSDHGVLVALSCKSPQRGCRVAVKFGWGLKRWRGDCVFNLRAS